MRSAPPSDQLTSSGLRPWWALSVTSLEGGPTSRGNGKSALGIGLPACDSVAVATMSRAHCAVPGVMMTEAG